VSLISKEDLESYADVLFWALGTSRAMPFKNGDLVLVRYDVPAVDLAEAVYARLIDAHLHPLCLSRPTPGMEACLCESGSFGQLTFERPGEVELFQKTAGVLNILAPADPAHLAHVDPRVVDQMRQGRLHAGQILERRRRAGLLGWTTCLHPTQALADAAGVDLEEYARLLARACYLNMADPVREWKRLREEVEDTGRWLDGLKATSYRLESASCDLTVEPGPHRRFVGVNGANIPGGELYIAPDGRSARGVFYADQPSLHMGHLVLGARLEFQNGIAVRAEAARGGQFLQQRLYADAGARRLGEFSLTDSRFSRVTRFMAHTLLDENLGGERGNCHIALGSAPLSSYSGPLEILTPEMEAEFGFNVSALHWDLVKTEPKVVTAALPGGAARVIYENGRFLR
jgi:aminopeptidase